MRATHHFDAFFYSLVSQDTREMYYSRKRQQFLVDQGYAFKTLRNLIKEDGMPCLYCNYNPKDNLLYGSKEEQLELLAAVLSVDEKEGETEKVMEELVLSSVLTSASTQHDFSPGFRRESSALEDWSGASGLVYREYDERENKTMAFDEENFG